MLNRLYVYYITSYIILNVHSGAPSSLRCVSSTVVFIRSGRELVIAVGVDIVLQ